MTSKRLFLATIGICLVLFSCAAFAQSCSEITFLEESIMAEENDSIEYPLLLQSESGDVFYIESIDVSDDSAFFNATYLKRDSDSIESYEFAEITIKIETDEVSSDKSGAITVKVAGHFSGGPNCTSGQIQQSFDTEVFDGGNWEEEAEETEDVTQTETQESETLPEETANTIFTATAVGNTGAIVNVSGTIIVQQEQKKVLVAISNNSATEQDFSVHWSTPFSSGVSPASGKIGAGRTADVILSVSPQEALEGSTYNCLLEVQLGGEKAFRNIKVIFKRKESEPQNGGEDSGTGLFSLAGLFSSAALLFTPENALNAALALVAAILLIAFIARFVKRLEAQKNEKH